MPLSDSPLASAQEVEERLSELDPQIDRLKRWSLYLTVATFVMILLVLAAYVLQEMSGPESAWRGLSKRLFLASIIPMFILFVAVMVLFLRHSNLTQEQDLLISKR